MKIIIIITGLLLNLLVASCSRPSAEDILKESYEKCQTVENGYYNMLHFMKFMYRNDTNLSNYQCDFQKLSDDTIYSSAFHMQEYIDGKYVRDVMYTGDDFVTYWKKDSIGEIMSKKMWAKEIFAYRHNYTFYSVLSSRTSYPLPQPTDFLDDKTSFQYIGEEQISEHPCYHVKMTTNPEKDTTEMLKILRIEKDFWIHMRDFIPIQYIITVTLEEAGDTLYEVNKNTLEKYEINNLNDKTLLTLESIPSYIKLKNFEPYQKTELLTKNTPAPNWTLPTLQNDSLSLSDMKGELVLLDFFYKSCHPCMLALPALQNLHEKYQNKGLRVIGIDPYDTKEKDDIENFLSARGVTYTILLDGKKVAKMYHIHGYPTIYLINQNGEIVFSQVGYGEGTKNSLEEIILEYLEK